MQASLLELLTSPHFADAEPGLSEAALVALEEALGATLPAAARELYRHCGGIANRVRTALPMRLMPPTDVVDTLQILSDCMDVYHPHPAARYLFTDDNSNWVGIFVEGPLCGKLTILDHDLGSNAPRFVDLASFLKKLVAAADRSDPWEQMSSDYPLTAASAGALIDEVAPLAAHYLAAYHAVQDPRTRNVAADIALHLTDPRQGDTVNAMLASPSPFARHVALQIVAVHQRIEWAPLLEAYGYAAIKQNDYGAWTNAVKAFAALGATPAVDALVLAAPANWPAPDGTRDLRPTDLTDEV